MITILTTLICIRAMRLEVYIPTPVRFGCDDDSVYQTYLAREYPRWHFKQWRCARGRFA